MTILLLPVILSNKRVICKLIVPPLHPQAMPTSQSGASMQINPTNMVVATELEQAGGLVAPSDGGSQASCQPWPALASAQGYIVSVIED